MVVVTGGTLQGRRSRWLRSLGVRCLSPPYPRRTGHTRLWRVSFWARAAGPSPRCGFNPREGKARPRKTTTSGLRRSAKKKRPGGWVVLVLVLRVVTLSEVVTQRRWIQIIGRRFDSWGGGRFVSEAGRFRKAPRTTTSGTCFPITTFRLCDCPYETSGLTLSFLSGQGRAFGRGGAERGGRGVRGGRRFARQPRSSHRASAQTIPDARCADSGGWAVDGVAEACPVDAST